MSKRHSTSNPKKNSNPGWKARAQNVRKEAAIERQKKYEALSLSEKIKRAGDKQKAKLQALKK